MPQVQHDVPGGAWAPDGKSFALSGNRRKPTDGEVFVWREGEDEPSYLFGEGKYAFAVSFSPDGSKLLAIEFRSNSDMSIWVVDVESGEATEATPHDDDVKFLPGPWARDGSGFYVLSDEGREFTGLAFHTLATGEREWVAAPDHDVEEIAGSADGRVLAWIENVDGWAELHVRDVERGVDLPAPKLPRGAVSILGSGMSLSHDGSRLAIVWEEPTRPAEVFVVDTATGDALPVTESRAAGLSALDFRAPELVAVPELRRQRDPGVAVPPRRGRARRRSPCSSTAARRRRSARSSGRTCQYLLVARHRRARDEHPRLDRLRQDVPDAHPPRLGRRRSRGLAPRGRVAARRSRSSTPTGSRSSAARTAASRRSRA